MRYDPDKHNRHSIRLRGYDYAAAGCYFVTICSYGRQCIFGEVVSGIMDLNDYGQIVMACWQAIPHHFAQADIDALVVMPNHVHGLVWIVNPVVRNVDVDVGDVGAQHAAPLPAPLPRQTPCRNVVPGSLGAIVRSFKAAATKRVNEIHQTPGVALWQRNYYERVIRDEEALARAREYILANPLHWKDDINHPDRL